jgi:hypothetical protein
LSGLFIGSLFSKFEPVLQWLESGSPPAKGAILPHCGDLAIFRGCIVTIWRRRSGELHAPGTVRRIHGRLHAYPSALTIRAVGTHSLMPPDLTVSCITVRATGDEASGRNRIRHRACPNCADKSTEQFRIDRASVSMASPRRPAE